MPVALASVALVLVLSAPPAGAVTPTCKTITNGKVCVSPVTFNGNPNYMWATYTVASNGHAVTGHVELGAVVPYGGPCGHGNALANSATVTVQPGGTLVVQWGPRNASYDFAATFWAGSGSSFTNYGTVCAEY
jgi:hypothetical protein